jgi:hypothetical protein
MTTDDDAPAGAGGVKTGKAVEVTSIFEMADSIHESTGTTIEVRGCRSDDVHDADVYIVAEADDGEARTDLDISVPEARHLAEAIEAAADRAEEEL